MSTRRSIKQKTSWVAKLAGALLVSCVLAGFIGFGFASATVGTVSGLFGDADTSSSADASLMESAAQETSVLTTVSSRDISEGVALIEAEEEAARLAEEEAARLEEEAHIAAVEAAQAKQEAQAASESVASSIASLSTVDWSVGEEAFVAEWTERIDAYLEGSALEGYGAVFAQAAWDYGVDPRWSPAISCTESTKGAYCFMQYNAWGWMTSTTWYSWEEGIYAHVKGLSEVYGYSITLEAAEMYCPPTYTEWFETTLSQMKLI